MRSDIKAALHHAETKHPHFPRTLIHQAAILAEEAGEVLKAALDNLYGPDPLKSEHEFYHEVAQVGAVVERILKARDE